MFSVLSVTIQICTILYVACEVYARLLRAPYAQWVRSRLRPILVLAFAVGMFSANKWVLCAFVVLIIPYMARTRSQIAPVYLVALLAVPPIAFPLQIGPLYLFGVDRNLFAALGAAIAYLMRPAGRALPKAGLDLPILFLVALEMTDARGSNFSNTLRIDVAIVCSLIIPYFVLSRSFRVREDVTRLMVAFGLCGFVMSVVGLYEAKRNTLPYLILQDRVGIFGTIFAYTHRRAGALRAGVSFVEATSFGLFLILCFIALLSIRDVFQTRRRWQVAIAGIMVGLYAANTKAALFGLVIGVLAFDLYRRRWGKLATKAAGMGALAMVALTIAQFSDKLAQRLGLTGDSVDTTDYRKQLATRGWEEIQKHPWFGVSPDQAYAAMADLKQGEGFIDFVNAYIWYGVTAGIVGMVVFLLIFLLPTIRALVSRRKLRRLPGASDLAASIFAAGLFSGVAAGTSGFNPRNALLLFMMFAGLSRMANMRPPAPEPIEPSPDEAEPATVPERTLAPA